MLQDIAGREWMMKISKKRPILILEKVLYMKLQMACWAADLSVHLSTQYKEQKEQNNLKKIDRNNWIHLIPSFSSLFAGIIGKFIFFDCYNKIIIQ
jgi:hypothetical protein